MVLNLENRRDQFIYFLGFAAKNRKKELTEVIKYYNQSKNVLFQPDQVFDICPYNDNLKQIMRSFYVIENTKKANMVSNLELIFQEFLFLASDFEGECCYDGRFFYSEYSSGEIVMECDRCYQMYNLEGETIKKEPQRLLTKNDFLKRFGSDTAACWPHHKKLLELSK